jgi:hypothetical protein
LVNTLLSHPNLNRRDNKKVQQQKERETTKQFISFPTKIYTYSEKKGKKNRKEAISNTSE